MSPHWCAGPDLWWRGKPKLWFVHSASDEEMFWKRCRSLSFFFFLSPPHFIISLIGFSCMLNFLNNPFFRPLVLLYVGILPGLQSSYTWAADPGTCFTTACCHQTFKTQTQSTRGSAGSRGTGKFGNWSYALVYFHTLLIAHCVSCFFLYLGCIKIKCQTPKWAWLRGFWWAALAFAIGSLGRWYLLAEMTVNWCSR